MNTPNIHIRPLPYEPLLDQRSPIDIDLAVIHCTELPDLAIARQFGEKVIYSPSGTGNSGHFYIDRCGRQERWVKPNRIAHHVRGFNERSIGIELVNLGRYPEWLHTDRQIMHEVYPGEQIDSLVVLLQGLCQTFPSLRWIAGHQDLDTERVSASNDDTLMVKRKLDPGPLFPWDRLEQKVPLQRFRLPVI